LALFFFSPMGASALAFDGLSRQWEPLSLRQSWPAKLDIRENFLLVSRHCGAVAFQRTRRSFGYTGYDEATRVLNRDGLRRDRGDLRLQTTECPAAPPAPSPRPRPRLSPPRSFHWAGGKSVKGLKENPIFRHLERIALPSPSFQPSEEEEEETLLRRLRLPRWPPQWRPSSGGCGELRRWVLLLAASTEYQVFHIKIPLASLSPPSFLPFEAQWTKLTERSAGRRTVSPLSHSGSGTARRRGGLGRRGQTVAAVPDGGRGREDHRADDEGEHAFDARAPETRRQPARRTRTYVRGRGSTRPPGRAGPFGWRFITLSNARADGVWLRP